MPTGPLAAAKVPARPTADALLAQLLRTVVDRDWEPTAAGRALHEAARGDRDLLRRVWVMLIRTHNHRTTTGRRALVTLTRALNVEG